MSSTNNTSIESNTNIPIDASTPNTDNNESVKSC